MKLHQNFSRKLIVIALIPYGLASFAATAAGILPHLQPKANQTGEVESRGTTIGGAVVGIRISDPDGVNYYEIYESGSKVVETAGNGGCEQSIEVALSAKKHNHPHTVRFTDCKGGSERWEANSLTQEYKLGSGPYPYFFPQKTQFAMRIVDMNLDTIPDIVVVNEGDQGLNVSVFVGNGDGSLEDPTFTEGRVMQLPNMDGFPNGNRF